MHTQETHVEALIAGLNEDLAAEYSAIIQYIYNASVVSGLSRQVLKPFFEGEARDEMSHASYLSGKIFNLGGNPIVQPTEVKRSTGVREMLENTLHEERETIQRYTQRIEQANKVGDIALKVQLEDMIADETRHMEDIERLLNDSMF